MTMVATSSARTAYRSDRSQRGLSLVEFALAMAILGIVALVAWQHGSDVARRQSTVQSRLLLERGEEAVRAFAFLHARLPCPSADARGVERCNGGVEGYLPYRTLGLSDTAAGAVRYRLGGPQLAAAGAVGFEVLVPVPHGADGDLAAEPVLLQTLATADNDHMADFCAALMGRGEPGKGEPQAPPADDAAFVMAKPGGSGSGRAVVRRSTIWRDANCAALLSTAGRAHFNARLQAAAMHRAIDDYRTQSGIAYGLYEWDFSQSNWFLANSGYSVLKTVVKLEIARVAWLASLAADPEPASGMLLAAGALVTSALHASVYASTVARGAVNLSNARRHRGVLDRLAAQANALERDIAVRALASSSNVLFLAQQTVPGAAAERAAADVWATADIADSAPPGVDPRVEALGEAARDYLGLIGPP
jgi:prepilin-type N-terminal cleavage/methylation domain-containing protein